MIGRNAMIQLAQALPGANAATPVNYGDWQAVERQRALAEAMQQAQYVPNSGALGAIAQVAQAWGGKKLGERSDKKFSELVRQQLESERSEEQRKAAEENAKTEQEMREKIEALSGVLGPEAATAVVRGGISPKDLRGEQGDALSKWLETQPPEVVDQAMKFKAGLAARPQAPGAPQAGPLGDFQAYLALPEDQRALYDQFKGRNLDVTQSVQQQKQDQSTAIKGAQLETLDRMLGRVTEATRAIAANPILNGGPMDKTVLQYLPEGQELQQAAASILPVLTALTRVPGVGSQSDLEARLSQLQLPSAEFPPEVNARALESLQAYARDLQAAYQNVQGARQGVSGSSAQANPHLPQIVPGGGWAIEQVE